MYRIFGLVVILCFAMMAYHIHVAFSHTEHDIITINVVASVIYIICGFINLAMFLRLHYRAKSNPQISFKDRLHFANKVIAQVKAGEWVPELYNPALVIQYQVYKLSRNEMTMLVANGAHFLRINEQDVFGLILAYYVWHKAVKQVVNDADSKLFKGNDLMLTMNKVLDKKPTLTVVK